MTTTNLKNLIATVLLLLCSLHGYAYDFEVDGICYKSTYPGYCEVTSNSNKYSGHIKLPASVYYNGNNYNVTSIGNRAFYGCSELIDVDIPKSVISIGDEAFYGCSALIYAYTGSSTLRSIGTNAFARCSSLKGFYIPSTITSIKSSAFYGCSGMTEIELESTSNMSIQGAFKGCNNIRKITYDEGSTVIYKLDVTSITSITIPNTITTIEDYALFGCTGLTSIKIPSSVTSIGHGAFEGCSGLTSIIVDSQNTYYDSRDNCNAIISTKDNRLIAGCKNTNIPSSVTSIGDYAFDGCSSMKSITIPSSVTSIGACAFRDCSGLTSITIPSSVTSIGEYAFKGCNNIRKITYDEGSTVIYKLDVTSITSITIPNTITTIEDFALSECTGLTSIKIPSSVTSIGHGAFAGCSGLTSIIVDSQNTYYDSRDNCNAIISTKDNRLIAGCKNTNTPSSVTSIGDFAFYRCSGLTSITIPSSVTSIGKEAFWYCNNVTSFYCDAITPPLCGSACFAGIDKSLCILYVPSESVSLYQAADQWMDFNTIETVGIDQIKVDEDSDSSNSVVDVYSLNGAKVRTHVNASTALEGLDKGIYIVKGEKVVVK